jgi:hypothetical protein
MTSHSAVEERLLLDQPSAVEKRLAGMTSKRGRLIRPSLADPYSALRVNHRGYTANVTARRSLRTGHLLPLRNGLAHFRFDPVESLLVDSVELGGIPPQAAIRGWLDVIDRQHVGVLLRVWIDVEGGRQAPPIALAQKPMIAEVVARPTTSACWCGFASTTRPAMG